MTKTAMMTGDNTDSTINNDRRRFAILPGGKEKRIRNRFGGEVPQYARELRHEGSRFTAEMKERSAHEQARQVLSSANAGQLIDPDCDFSHDFCPISQEPRVTDGSITFSTDDGAEITIVYIGGSIGSAHIRPARRYY